MTRARAAQRVTVMGLGLQGGGVEVARYFAERGAAVTVTDQRSAEELRESIDALREHELRYVLGGHDPRDFAECDLVVANPAVSPAHACLQAARQAGVPISSDTAIYLEQTGARLVLVTGTQGKSSTSHLLSGLLQAAGRTCELGGNIGRSLLRTLKGEASDKIVVLEISSYQLEALPPGLRPRRVAAVCVTNIEPDHLERHGSLEEYERAKRRVLELVDDQGAVVLNGEDARLARWRVERGRRIDFYPNRFAQEAAEEVPAESWCVRADAFWVEGERIAPVDDLRLPGDFQRGNALAALGIARALGVEGAQLARALPTLAGLEHRLQDLGVFAGHRVWDNGVSTTPDSTAAALRSLAGPCVLLCGGRSKELPLDALVAAARERAHTLIAFGESGPALARELSGAGLDVHVTASLEEGVRAAFAEMRSEDELLFSPACASFDAFRNFKERAMAFRAALPESR